MGILRNARQERYCQLIASGVTQDKAYTEAGYKPSPPHASRLASKGNIRARIRELTAPAVEKAQLTTEMVVEGLLKEAMDEDNNGSARVTAWNVLGKICGAVVEKRENKNTSETTVTLEQRQAVIKNPALRKQLIDAMSQVTEN